MIVLALVILRFNSVRHTNYHTIPCLLITDVCIPHVWRTVEEGMSNKLYTGMRQILPVQPPNCVYKCITFPAGQYTPQGLAAALEAV